MLAFLRPVKFIAFTGSALPDAAGGGGDHHHPAGRGGHEPDQEHCGLGEKRCRSRSPAAAVGFWTWICSGDIHAIDVRRAVLVLAGLIVATARLILRDPRL